MLRKIRTYLFIGTLAALPAIATIYVLQLLFSIIDPMLGIAVADLLHWIGLVHFPLKIGALKFETYVPGVGMLLTLVLLILIGMLTRSFFGKQIIKFTEGFFSRIPIARSIYSTVQQMTSAFVQDQSAFKRVVMIQYPRKGLYTLGFYTADSNDEVIEKANKPMVNVFLPTTPNPTSGWMVLVPKEDVIFLDMSVEEGLKYIISGGVVVPPRVVEKESVSVLEHKN